jgi:hypothetical protein
MFGKRWPLIAAMFSIVAAAQTPPATAPRPAQPQTPAHDDTPDEGLLEFLGSDDVNDTAWWEFLKRTPARGSDPPPPPPPPQDAKK